MTANTGLTLALEMGRIGVRTVSRLWDKGNHAESRRAFSMKIAIEDRKHCGYERAAGGSQSKEWSTR